MLTPTQTPFATPSATPSPTPTETETPFFGETPPLEETVPPEETLPAEQTPTPTPTPEDPAKTILQAHMGRVLTFMPVGFADDGASTYLSQLQGTTGRGTLVAPSAPAAT